MSRHKQRPDLKFNLFTCIVCKESEKDSAFEIDGKVYQNIRIEGLCSKCNESIDKQAKVKS